MQWNRRQSANVTEPKASLGSRIRERAARVRESISPSPRAWHGAAIAVAVVALLVWLWATLPQIVPSALTSSLLIAGADLLVAPLAAGVLLIVLGRLTALPRFFRWMLVTAVVLLVTLGSGPSQRGWLLTTAVLVLTVSLIGGVLWSLAGGGWSRMGRLSRLLSLGGLLLSLLVLGAGGYWLLRPGTPAPELPNAARLGEPVAPSKLSDPSQPGPYAVQTLTYGSGQDRQRPEYGAQVSLTTSSVDASNIVRGWEGMAGEARTSFWGFDTRALPINGRVWYPEGEGLFPLVLIVHGNSRAEDFSDPGFAYLGELLGSRGFIVASVDENFLNTGLIDSTGGLTGANAARAWLLLEHLRVWHAWNEQSDNQFYQQVDTQNIALIGHSRGGEAVALAAAFNRLDRFPDDATVPFDYGYAIRTVVAVAPSDAQYMPMGEKIALENINYLTLQGSHDADVISFAGLNQYHRVAFSQGEEWIKAALYIYRANHSRFNTTWDPYDVGEGMSARFLNTAALLPAEEQRKVAQVVIAAFLETTLHDAADYRPLFRDIRLASAWLPATVYRSQYSDAATKYLSTYEEDVDVSSTTLAGGLQAGANLWQWQEQHLPLRLGAGDDRAVRLGWQRTDSSGEPRYTIKLPAEGITLTQGSILRFDLADVGASTLPGTVAAADTAELVNFSIEVQDADGDTAQLPLSHVSALQPPIAGQYLKSALLHEIPMSEPILQTFNFPLADFASADGAFEPTKLVAIALVFNDTPAGAVFLDNIGIAAASIAPQ